MKMIMKNFLNLSLKIIKVKILNSWHTIDHGNGIVEQYDNHGSQYWFLNGRFHYENGPAVTYPSGRKEWHKNGRCHREDGPAIETANGDKYWYIDGKNHREDGPAIEYANGRKEWWINGERHRKDGPAIESFDEKYWYVNGLLHREDGPAVEFTDGSKYSYSWYINGKEISEQELNRIKLQKELDKSLLIKDTNKKKLKI